MKIIAVIGAFIIGVTMILIRRLVPVVKTKQLPQLPVRQPGPHHYKIIEKAGRQVGVKFDAAGHQKYFFNNN